MFGLVVKSFVFLQNLIELNLFDHLIVVAGITPCMKVRVGVIKDFTAEFIELVMLVLYSFKSTISSVVAMYLKDS